MHPVFEADLVAAGRDLPDAGEARFHGKTPALPDLIFFDFGGDRRSGTDQAHFAFQHIDKLGQFVQAGFSEEGTDYRDDPGVFSKFEFPAACRSYAEVPALQAGTSRDEFK